MKTRIYHLGLLKRGRVLVLQVADSVDQLSCELWRYYGQRENTISRLHRDRFKLLEAVNRQEGAAFQRVKIERVPAWDYTAGH